MTRLGIQADEEEVELETPGASLGLQVPQQLQHQCPETPGRLSRRNRQESPGEKDIISQKEIDLVLDLTW